MACMIVRYIIIGAMEWSGECGHVVCTQSSIKLWCVIMNRYKYWRFSSSGFSSGFFPTPKLNYVWTYYLVSV